MTANDLYHVKAEEQHERLEPVDYAHRDLTRADILRQLAELEEDCDD
jgi:hypothetical protein